MRIGFVINGIETEQAGYTTVRLALAASRMGHDVWLIGLEDFSPRARRDGVGARAGGAGKEVSVTRGLSRQGAGATRESPSVSRSTDSTCS
jgi:glutathione synthase